MNAHRKLIIIALILATLAGSRLSSAQAAPHATITVQSAADDGTVNAANCPGANCRLRDAIAYAAAGDTITFSGDYTITLASQLTIEKDLTIDGAGHTVAINGNHAVRVFYVNSGYTFNLQNLTVTGGNCGDACGGGGLYNSAGSTVNVVNSTFSDNINPDPSFGGGLYNESGTLNVTSSIFSNNSASYAGGGIFNWSGTLNVTNSTFFSNSVPIDNIVPNRYGGGINTYNGTTTVKNSTFSSNSAVAAGGLYVNSGTVTVQNSTFSGNQADIGGGLYTDYGAITVTNSTFTGNSATGAGGIGNNSGAITVTNSTITGNSGSIVGGGIINNDGIVTVTNSIIAAQTAGTDCVGAIISQGYNIESATTCGFNQTGDQQNVANGSLNLQVLANNGILPHPFTHALGVGSVAIDKIPNGVNGCVAGVSIDERGAVRAGGGTHGGALCDIGAYEVSDQGPNTVTLRDLTAAANTPSSITGVMGAAFASLTMLSALLIGRRVKAKVRP